MHTIQYALGIKSTHFANRKLDRNRISTTRNHAEPLVLWTESLLFKWSPVPYILLRTVRHILFQNISMANVNAATAKRHPMDKNIPCTSTRPACKSKWTMNYSITQKVKLEKLVEFISNFKSLILPSGQEVCHQFHMWLWDSYNLPSIWQWFLFPTVSEC